MNLTEQDSTVTATPPPTPRYIKQLYDQAEFESIVALGEKHPDLSQLAEYKESQAACDLMVRAQQPANQQPRPRRGGLRVVTVLHTSLPHFPGGYAGRAHGLLRGFHKAGLNAMPVTRPGYWRTTSAGKATKSSTEIYDGVTYRHLDSPFDRSKGEYRYMQACVDIYREFFDSAAPDVIHLRSTYLIALPAMIAAHEAGIPCTYEVSGLWELVHEGRNQHGLAKRTAKLESAVMANVENIATLTEAMATIIKTRTHQNTKVTVTPNAVDPHEFSAFHKAEYSEIPVIGYVGSILDYEGLDTLVQAVAQINAVNTVAKLRIVGGGPELKNIQNLSGHLGGEAYTTFTGPLSPEAAANEYANIDICAFPRHSTPATEAVSPLKPFEAIAARKPFVVSDVAALTEIAGTDRALVCRPSDSESLAHSLHKLINDPEQAKQMAARAYERMQQEHTWPVVASSVKSCLQQAIEIHSSALQSSTSTG